MKIEKAIAIEDNVSKTLEQKKTAKKQQKNLMKRLKDRKRQSQNEKNSEKKDENEEISNTARKRSRRHEKVELLTEDLKFVMKTFEVDMKEVVFMTASFSSAEVNLQQKQRIDQKFEQMKERLINRLKSRFEEVLKRLMRSRD